tara:strand:+ start:298 stop:540 length:243 start_codon:yes stop_codon:yes gene_type:complete
MSELVAVVREDLKYDNTEAFYGSIDSWGCIESSTGTIPNSAYPIKVLHQDDNGLVYLLLDDDVVVAQSIDFDIVLEKRGK